MGQLPVSVVAKDRYPTAKQEKQGGLILRGTPDSSHSCVCSLTCLMAGHDALLSCLWSAQTDYRSSCEKDKLFHYLQFTEEMTDLNTAHFYNSLPFLTCHMLAAS